MSSIPQPPSLANHKPLAFAGIRPISNQHHFHFPRRYPPINDNNKYSRSVSRLTPVVSKNLLFRNRRIRDWRHRIGLSEYGGFGNIKDDGDQDAEGRSVELLVRFVQNVFKKITSEARKAVRSVLPVSIPNELVCFSVDGVTILAFLWIAKAFLEVICIVGCVVFISILVLRGIWYGIAYVRERHTNKKNILIDEQLWSNTRPAM